MSPAPGTPRPTKGPEVVDAATGEAVARVSASGLDTRALVDHARTVGGPALRGMTFQARAAALRELATTWTPTKPRITSSRSPPARRGVTAPAISTAGSGPRSCMQPRQARAARRLPDRRRRRRKPIGKEGHVRRAARLHVAARRRAADQRVQLPGLGHAREARARSPRRYADDRQTRRTDGISHCGWWCATSSRRVRFRRAPCNSCAAGSAICSNTSVARTSSRSRAARASPRRCGDNAAVTTRAARFNAETDSLELLHPGTRCRCRDTGVRPVRERGRT